MLSRVSKFLKTSVLHARITGKIDEEISQNLYRELKKFRISAPKLIAVSINTNSGTYGQAEEIVKILEDNSKRFDCPVYTFAEDIVAGPGYYILASGNRVFADPFSLVGGISVSLRTFDLTKFGKDNGIKVNVESLGKNKVRVHPFLDLTEENRAWVQSLLQEREQIIKKYVLERRGHKIPRDKEKESAALGGDVFIGAKAAQLGLVDSVHSFRTIFQKEYYDSKIVELKLNKGKKKHFGSIGERIKLGGEEVEEIIDELPANLIANRLSYKLFT